MRMTIMPLIVLSISIMTQISQPVFAESHDIVSPKAVMGDEFLGVNHVLDILANINIRRLDRDSIKTFEEYVDAKNAVNNRPVEHSVTTATVYPNRLAAPRKLNQRLF